MSKYARIICYHLELTTLTGRIDIKPGGIRAYGLDWSIEVLLDGRYHSEGPMMPVNRIAVSTKVSEKSGSVFLSDGHEESTRHRR